MKDIQIFLSTYNGEKYLRAQLNSFLTLSNFERIKVLIRDDGSTDGTRAILEEYSERYGFEVIFGENVGLNASMHELVLASDPACRFFAFSDQDDVWLSNKLYRAAERLAPFAESDIPVLYAASSTLVDEQLRKIGHTAIPKRKPSFYNALVENVCVGHTQVCNRAAIELLKLGHSKDVMVMDYWVYTVVSAFGRIVYDPVYTTLYRQHGKNVIGYSSSRWSNFKMRLKRLSSRRSELNTKQLAAFLDIYGSSIPDDYRREGERFLNKQKNFFTRAGYIFMTKAYRQKRTECLVFRLMYLFGRYKIKKYKE
ncbi:MAG: glycosyltransferase [Clostridia bacterium]|nr:glycosyltransferase [Clostridia bacterium]